MNMLMIGEDERILKHEKADILMASYVLKAASERKNVIHILSDDTCVCHSHLLCMEAQHHMPSSNGEVGWKHAQHHPNC